MTDHTNTDKELITEAKRRGFDVRADPTWNAYALYVDGVRIDEVDRGHTKEDRAEARGEMLAKLDRMAKPKESNLTRTRKAVVTSVCEALAAIINPNAPGTVYAAACENEFFIENTKNIREIVAQCDSVDELVMFAFDGKNNADGEWCAWVRITWGQGAGCCINDYSAWLDGNPNWQTVLDYVEFLEI